MFNIFYFINDFLIAIHPITSYLNNDIWPLRTKVNLEIFIRAIDREKNTKYSMYQKLVKAMKKNISENLSHEKKQTVLNNELTHAI